MKQRDINNLGEQRAYATFEITNIKEAKGETKRTFTGVASTIEADLMDDVVMPDGAEYKLPLPLIWAHDATKPIGWVRAVRVKKDRIEVDCEVHDEKEPGELKNFLDKCWQSLRAGLVRGLSIGFSPIESAKIEGSWGYKFIRWFWHELSPVVIPANQLSGVTNIKQIKSLDSALLAASGREQREVKQAKPGGSGTSTVNRQKGTDMKTIAQLREERETKAARLQEMLEAKRASETGRFTDDERKEFDAIGAEIEDLDDEIRVKNFHTDNVKTATPVEGGQQRRSFGGAGGMSFVRKQDPEDKFKGQSKVRAIIARAASELLGGSPSAIAEYRWGKTHPNLVAFIKANEVAGGGTGSGEWGAELVSMDGRFTGDFIEFLYGATVFDKLPFREIPANVTIKGQDGESTGYWVGESKAIPATTGDFSTVNLSPLKVAALAVMSNDLIRYSSPAAEQLVANSLREASAKRIDQTVFSANAASAGVSPAGLLNGLSAIATTGTDEAAVRSMISLLYAPFITAKNSMGLTFVMGPAQAKAISMLVNALGQTSFPGMTGKGGSLLGDDVVVGDNIDASQVILLKSSDIYKIGDSGVEVSISKEATIEQSSVPTGATDTPTAMTVAAPATNMFQEDSTAMKIVRHINFAKRRSTAVAYTDTADFQGVSS